MHGDPDSYKMSSVVELCHEQGTEYWLPQKCRLCSVRTLHQQRMLEHKDYGVTVYSAAVGLRTRS